MTLVLARLQEAEQRSDAVGVWRPRSASLLGLRRPIAACGRDNATEEMYCGCMTVDPSTVAWPDSAGAGYGSRRTSFADLSRRKPRNAA
jgi:hypothetical protein